MKFSLLSGLLAVSLLLTLSPSIAIYPSHLKQSHYIPEQTATDALPFSHKGFLIKPLADFSLEAKVLHLKRYTDDKEAELSPIDLALGWGPMSLHDVTQHIEITQKDRWYYWQTNNSPITKKSIELNSANMHLIPSTDKIDQQLKLIRLGDTVIFDGYLVKCSKKNWLWTSSLTRNDTGDGACEIVYIRHLKILPATQNSEKQATEVFDGQLANN